MVGFPLYDRLQSRFHTRGRVDGEWKDTIRVFHSDFWLLMQQTCKERFVLFDFWLSAQCAKLDSLMQKSKFARLLAKLDWGADWLKMSAASTNSFCKTHKTAISITGNFCEHVFVCLSVQIWGMQRHQQFQLFQIRLFLSPLLLLWRFFISTNSMWYDICLLQVRAMLMMRTSQICVCVCAVVLFSGVLGSVRHWLYINEDRAAWPALLI